MKNIFRIALIFGILFSLFSSVDIVSATNYGEVIGTYRGINAYSNGEYTGTGNGLYQCVEYVKRFYRDAMGVDTSSWTGNANTYYGTASAKGLDAYPNGGDRPPQIDDILAFSGGPNGYGHIAIITEVGNTYVKIIEQNINRDTAYATLQRSGNTIQNRGSLTTQGWLRRKGPRILGQSVYCNGMSCGTTPVPPGGRLTFVYSINNPYSYNINNVRLGARIRTNSPQGQWIDDWNNDRVETLSPGTHDKSRDFIVPQSASSGYYDAEWVILEHYSPNRWYDVKDMLRILQVNYQQNTYTITVSTNPSGLSPQPTGGGTYNSGATATVVAQQVSSYTFQKWTENGVQVSTSMSYSFTVTGNRNLVAEYSQNPIQYTISVSTSPPGLTPQPTGGGTYNSGATATVVAQQVSSYTFQKWTEGGSQVSTSMSYSFTVTGNRNLVAEYIQDTSNLVLGIDVSHWQGSINWASVKNAGYKFAFAKATEGVGFTDTNFVTNMNNGRSNGMLMGAYHFARPDLNSAVAEANYFVSVAGPYLTSGYLRPALDVETGSNLGKTALSNWINTWIDTVKSQTGVEAILYMNSNYATNYVDSSVTQRNLWIAHWTYNPNGNPNTGIWSTWNFWQYSNQGSVPGISGNVDLDKFNGAESGLNNFVIQTQQNNPPNVPTALAQYKSDGVTGIPLGGTTTESTVVAKGGVSDPDSDTVQLEVEVKPVGTVFTNTPNCTPGSAVPSGSTASATCSGLANGQYHWQARAKDSKGATGNWLSAGGNPESSPDFIVNMPTGQSLKVFVRGTDNSVWYKKWNGASWDNWQSLGGNIYDLDAKSDYVVVRGTDNAVWYRKWDGTSWANWQSLGGNIIARPVIAPSGSNIYIFARGADNAVWYRKWNGASWDDWQGLGGNIASEIAASANSDINIFVRGTDNGIWTRKWNGASWNNWQGLGGAITADPDSVSSSSQTYVFARGTDSAVWYRKWDGTSWNAWQGLGGNIASSVSSSDTSDVNIFVRGGDNAIWTRKWNGASWNDWQGLGGITNSDPDSISLASQAYVFARGGDNGLWYRKWNGASWDNWQGLGGNIISEPVVTG